MEKEDPPEIRDVNVALDPFPEENDKKFPQENKAYFKKKKYCRKDKYSLEWILMLNVEIPPIVSAFKCKPRRKYG